jgi:hypothetical protein
MRRRRIRTERSGHERERVEITGEHARKDDVSARWSRSRPDVACVPNLIYVDP